MHVTVFNVYIYAPSQGCIMAIKLFLLKNLVWVGAVCIALGIGEVQNCC